MEQGIVIRQDDPRVNDPSSTFHLVKLIKRLGGDSSEQTAVSEATEPKKPKKESLNWVYQNSNAVKGSA
jgi:hypothetical protein